MAIATPESSSKEGTEAPDTGITIIKPAVPASSQVLRPNMGGNNYWWEELDDDTSEQDIDEEERLSRDEVGGNIHVSKMESSTRAPYQGSLTPLIQLLLAGLAYQVNELVEDTAAFINVLDDIQPLDNRRYNAFAEVWRRIERIPPEHRHLLLHEIGPGGWVPAKGRQHPPYFY
jgi:hypothetical protein